MLRITITDDEGEVYDTLHRDDEGRWTDADGTAVAETDYQLAGTAGRYHLPDLIEGALAWVRTKRAKAST